MVFGYSTNAYVKYSVEESLERIADLLGRMTLEEKVAQMMASWNDKANIVDGLEFSAERAAATRRSGRARRLDRGQ